MTSLDGVVDEIAGAASLTKTNELSPRQRRASRPTNPSKNSPAASDCADRELNAPHFEIAGTPDQASAQVNPIVTLPDRDPFSGHFIGEAQDTSAADGRATVDPIPKVVVPGHPLDGNGRLSLESHDTHAVSSDGAVHPATGTQASCSPAIATIVQLWRMRQRWHRAEKSLILQGKAICRAWTDGDKTEAGKLYDAAARGADTDPQLLMALQPFLDASTNFTSLRKPIERQLQKLAKTCPGAEFVADVRGFGFGNFAALIGECGDIAGYRSVSAVWKRMGLAVIDGERQRKCANAEKALQHGYNPARRAVAYLLGDCLVKANRGLYRGIYDARKELEATRVETKAHAHNRAARYMTKRCLADLYGAVTRETTP